MVAHVLQHCLDYNRGFPWITAVLKDSVWNELMADAKRWVILIRRREDDEVPLIELVIRKRNEAVMARPIMPPQSANGLE
jgi:hypothetical protein